MASTVKVSDTLSTVVNRINAEVECHHRAMQLRTMPLDRSTRKSMQPHLEPVVVLFERLDKHRANLESYLRREEALNARVLRIRARSLRQARRIAAIRARLPDHLSNALDEALVQHEKESHEPEPEQNHPVTVPEPIVEPEAEPEPEPMPRCEYPQIYRVTDMELRDCPQYVKGRLTVEKIGRVVDKLNLFVCTKYAIVNRSLRECRAGPDRERWQAFKDSDCPETGGETFVTDLELRAFSDFKMDATARQTINVLRHIGRLKEVRGKKKARCFILKGGRSW